MNNKSNISDRKKHSSTKIYKQDIHFLQKFFNIPIDELLSLLNHSIGFRFDIYENKHDHFHWITLENKEPDSDGFEVNIKFIDAPNSNSLYSFNSSVEFELFDVDGTYKGGLGNLLAVINIIAKVIGDVRELEESLMAKRNIALTKK